MQVNAIVAVSDVSGLNNRTIRLADMHNAGAGLPLVANDCAGGRVACLTKVETNRLFHLVHSSTPGKERLNVGAESAVDNRGDESGGRIFQKLQIVFLRENCGAKGF
jgi:hypothetical protein